MNTPFCAFLAPYYAVGNVTYIPNPEPCRSHLSPRQYHHNPLSSTPPQGELVSDAPVCARPNMKKRLLRRNLSVSCGDTFSAMATRILKPGMLELPAEDITMIIYSTRHPQLSLEIGGVVYL